MSGGRQVRTLTFLLVTYYLTAVFANTQSLKEIKSKVALEIEVQKIKNNIIQKLRNKGAQINLPRNGQFNANGHSRDSDIASSRIITDANVIPSHVPYDEDVRTPDGMSTLHIDVNAFPTGSPPDRDEQPKSKPLIVIGESRSKNKKDKCLNFRFGKYMKTDTIVPIRMNLWIFLRVQRNRKKKKDVSFLGKESVSRKNKNSKSNLENPFQQRAKRQTKAKKKNKRRKNKKGRKKKNKRGRKVKIFVSDETKELVILRMRVKKTNWYMLELPISQFPSIISFNYTRTLCIQCKRCNRKIKVDLRSKRLLEDPTVPFIHIEPLQSLPHSIYRQNSRRRRSSYRSGEARVPSPCCREDVHTEFIAKEFPNVLYPLSFNISMCTHLSHDVTTPRDVSRDMNTPLLSQQNSSISHQVSSQSLSRRLPLRMPTRMRCETETMAPLTITFIDRRLVVKQTTINHLLPTGCRCKQIVG